jgi:pSer/pThr/pTyr-binding forkhead associated (FHA) protein
VTHDFYDVLGVPDEATPEEIRRAYRDLAKVAMADRPRFERISKAFETLKDPARRAAYDRQRRLGVLPDDDEEGAVPAGSTPVAASRGVTMNSTLQQTAADGATVAMTPTQMGEGATVIGAPPVPVVGGGATIGFGGATAQLALPPCPVCRTPGAPGEEFCLECGLLVGSTPGAAGMERPLPRLRAEDGREFPLKPGENVVGREGADVMLPDKSVSRRHALLVVGDDGSVMAEDLGSTNATKAAGQRLEAGQRAMLYDGAPVRFGAVKMTISVPAVPGAERLALPAPSTNQSGGEQTRQPIAALGAGFAPDRTMTASAARLVAGDGKVFVLSSTNVTVGRKPENAVVLTGDSYVSGSHARIVYEADGFAVVDVGSTNGTRVNGQKLEPNAPQPLSDGDEVVFGQTALTFRAPSTGAG